MSIKDDNIIAGVVSAVVGGVCMYLIALCCIPSERWFLYFSIISIPWSTFAAWCIYSGFNRKFVTIHKDTDDDRETFAKVLGIPPAVFLFIVIVLNIIDVRTDGGVQRMLRGFPDEI